MTSLELEPFDLRLKGMLFKKCATDKYVPSFPESIHVNTI